MKRFTGITMATLSAFAITLALGSTQAQATHYRGGLMTWSVVNKVGPPTSYPRTVQTEMLSMSLSGAPVTQDLTLPEVGQFNVDSFFDVFTELSIDGQTFNVDSFFDITYKVSPGSGCVGCWQTEMVSLDLSGQAPGGPPIIVRLAPGQPSLGEIQATDLPDGTFRIDSFFDVFTEISIDGDPFVPATSPMRVELQGNALPEPASIALLGLGVTALLKRSQKQSLTRRQNNEAN